ncbi:uncharacterized protein LOC115597125 [Sparus aurata]|uniref:uncharacterized protein LOC115597125 n=1 Tax=Sparus aurata TaxID=8175 RepID=UPI0011C122F6|nr:uncharacterized protein LOC115597125 [Sparus aurata]
MSDRSFSESWLSVDDTGPTWDECYAVSSTDWIFEGDIVIPNSTMESELDDFGPGAKDPSDPTDEERSLSSPVLPLDMLPSLNSPLPSPSTSSPPPHTAPRIRARRFHRFKAPFPMRHSCGGGGGGGCCCCCNCNWRSFRPRRSKLRIYRPGKRKWEHLPVVMRPCRWYQVVGSMQCIHCEARGRHQLTSWMCQSCHVPLCLMPYRNCYAKWHDQRC